MPVRLTVPQLQAIVTLRQAMNLATYDAARLSPDKAASTPMRELPRAEWADPVWQNYVQNAFTTVNRMLGNSNPGRFLDLTAPFAKLLVDQLIGTLNDQGDVVGTISVNPSLVRYAASNRLFGGGTGRLKFFGLVTAGALVSFIAGRAAFKAR